jgi:cytochrome P450
MYGLTELAVNPEVQEELYREIQTVCGDRLPVYTDIPNLTYALCVMYETMRLYPIIGSISSTVSGNQDRTLLGKYPIPKDACIGLDFYNVHRNEKYWDNAHDFDPSRFDSRKSEGKEGWYTMPDGKTKIPVRCAFFGFSDGPRACAGIYFLFYSTERLGRKFAEMEFLTCLAIVIQKWTIHLKEDWTVQQARDTLHEKMHVLTLQPVSNVPLVFKRR